MRLLKKYQRFINENAEEDIEASGVVEDTPPQSTTAVLNLSSNPDGSTIDKKINQSQFNQGGSIRYSDVDGFEKPSNETSPFMKEPGEEYSISEVPNGLKISYQGSTYVVVSKS